MNRKACIIRTAAFVAVFAQTWTFGNGLVWSLTVYKGGYSRQHMFNYFEYAMPAKTAYHMAASHLRLMQGRLERGWYD